MKIWASVVACTILVLQYDVVTLHLLGCESVCEIDMFL